MPKNTEATKSVGRLHLKLRVGRGKPGVVIRPPVGPEIRVSVFKTSSDGGQATVVFEAPRDVVVLREALLQPRPPKGESDEQ